MPSVVELLNFVEYLISTWGILIVPIGAFLENSVILSFIFPGVTVIFLSGFVLRTTGDNLGLIIALATIGAFLGDNLDYFIGKRASLLIEQKPLFTKPIHLVRPFLKRHGIWAVFVGRFNSWSRAWIAMACGVTNFSYIKFALVSFVSAFVWTTLWIVGGYLVGGNRGLIEEWLSRVSLVAWIGIIVLLVYYFRSRIKLIHDLVLFTTKKYTRRIRDGIKRSNKL